MACFVAPMAEAIVVTIVKVVIEKKERKALAEGSTLKPSSSLSKTGISWSKKLSWLNLMLWGGVVLLALEHLWHGEIVPFPPFLTAMRNPDEIVPMLHEIATFGVTMAVVVTAVWVVMVLIADYKAKHISAKVEKAM